MINPQQNNFHFFPSLSYAYQIDYVWGNYASIDFIGFAWNMKTRQQLVIIQHMVWKVLRTPVQFSLLMKQSVVGEVLVELLN